MAGRHSLNLVKKILLTSVTVAFLFVIFASEPKVVDEPNRSDQPETNSASNSYDAELNRKFNLMEGTGRFNRIRYEEECTLGIKYRLS